MRTQITILLSFLVTVGFSQVRPDQFLEQTNPMNANFEFYSQKGGAPRRATFTNVKKNMVPFVTDTLAGVPTATGNLTNLGEFIWDQYGALWYIDGEGDAVSFTGGGPIYVLPDTTAQTLVYAPSHGLTDTITLYGYVPVKADFTRANSSAVDSSFIAYAIDAPHPDSLLLVFSGLLTYATWHGKEINTQYYLQDDGSEDTTPGTISIPTAIASDSLTLFLREVGADIAGRLRRIAMPSPLITAFGGNPASPTDAVVQAAIEGTYLPAGLAQPGTVFTLSYATQSYNPIYQQVLPNTNPLTPSYAWLWDGALATRIVNIPTSVNLQDTNYGVLGTLVLLPIDSLGSLPPTDSLVAMWVDTNYTANNLRLANGSLLYYIGDGTRQSPDYVWQIIDDISYDAGDTDWEKIIKKINQPGGSVPAIRNDLPNESILIDPNNNDLVIGADSLDNTGEIEFFTLTPVDSQNVAFFIGQRDSSSVATGEGFPMDALISSFGDEDGVIGINFDYFGTVWNTAMFGDSMLVAAYPSSTLTYVLEDLPRSPADTMSAVLVQDWSTKRVYVRDADSFGSEPDSTVFATLYALSDSLDAIYNIYTADGTLTGNRTIDGDGNLLYMLGGFASVVDSLWYANQGEPGFTPSGVNYILTSFLSEAPMGVTVQKGNDYATSTAYYDNAPYSALQAKIGADSSAVTVGNGDIFLTADTLDATGVTTFLGFPNGGDGNGLFDADNNGDTVRISSALLKSSLVFSSGLYSVKSDNNSPLPALWGANAGSGAGVTASSVSGYAFDGAVGPSTTNTIVPALNLARNTTGTAASGLGVSISTSLEASNGLLYPAGYIGVKWTDATMATRTSAWEVYGVNSAATARKLAIAGSGQLTLDGYANNALNNVDSSLYVLAVDASGDVHTRAASGLGDGNGIYSGSGTVPASTWVEQLGSLIFDIDSLGSFTVGDIDEKNTGAKISISNTGGNDGGIIIKSGSGAGYTDATVEVNNYYLPGTTPTGEGLPAGDYMWIVSQAGVRKGQDSTGWIHIDSLLSGYTTGSGTTGTLPIWTGANSLGNSSITESGTVVGTSLTGAFGLAVGTDAQRPVGATGQIRYNTTGGGVEAWNGGLAAYTYLPWASVASFTSGSVLFADASGRVSQDNSGLFYNSSSDELRIGGTTDRGDYDLQLNGAGMYIESAYPAIYIKGGYIEFGPTPLGGIDASPINYQGSFLNIDNRNSAANDVGAIRAYGMRPSIIGSGNSVSSASVALLLSNRKPGAASSGVHNSVTEVLRISPESTYGESAMNGYGFTVGGGFSIDWHYKTDAGTDYRWKAGRITPIVINSDADNLEDTELALYAAVNKVLTKIMALDSAGIKSPLYAAGALTGTHNVSASWNSEGRLISVPEKWASISTSTDGSGDIVVAHGMGVTPTSVQVTVTGTTPYVVTVHSIDATNFTVRFYDMTGAAVASTAVTATWHCKT